MAKIIHVPMPVYNCFRECEEGVKYMPRYAECDVDSFMLPLIAALSKDRPSWKFIFRGSDNPLSGTTRYMAHKAVIFDGDDELGWIGKGWVHNVGDSYEFDNARLRKKRERGYASRTKDLKKAAKTIKDNFYGPTMSERIDIALQATTTVLNNNRANYSYRVTDISNQLRMELGQFLLDNWEQFCRIPLTEKQIKLRDMLPENHEGLATTLPMVEEFSSKNGSTIMVLGNTYYKINWDLVSSSYVPVPYTTDTLPDYIKGAVGMLKLVDVATPIKGIGTRIDNNLYYVMDPKE